MKPRKPLLVFIAGATVTLLAIVAVPSHPGVDVPEALPIHRPRRAPDPPAPAPPDELLVEQRLRSEQLTWGRDPFRRPVSNSDPTPTDTTRRLTRPQLTGISIRDGIPWAIIDRELVQEGDLLPSGYVVEKIADGTATLRRDEEELSLSLGDER